MHISSPFPPVPPLAPLNFHSVLFERPPGNQLPLDHIQYIDGRTGEGVSYGSLVERIRDGATALATSEADGVLGVEIPQQDPRTCGEAGYADAAETSPREVVAILAPNCLDYIILVHACIALTVPFALLPSNPTLSELVYLLNKTTPTRLFVHPTLLPLAREASAQASIPDARVYLLDGYDATRADFSCLIDNVRRGKLPRHEVVPADKNTLAYLMFSSGTSGMPKAVMITHGNLQFSIAQMLISLRERMKVAPQQPTARAIWLSLLPFYHSFGLHFTMFRVFVAPTTIVFFPKWNVNHALAAIPKYKITHLALVPSYAHQLVHSPKTAQTDVSTVIFAGSGAASLQPEVSKRMTTIFNAIGEVVEGYGLTEATIASMARPILGLLGLQPKPNSTGILLAGQEARLLDEDGKPVGVYEPGELYLRGGSVALGYWKDEAATRATFTEDGWLRTGDLFRVDESGTFYYEDRVKDTLKVSGAQVSPAEIELTLLSHPDKLIIDTAVAGVNSDASRRDEKVPRAWVVLSDAGRAHGERKVCEALLEWVEERLSRYKWLKGGIEVVNVIPKSPTGKVLRRVLQERYEATRTEKTDGLAKVTSKL